MFRLHHSLGDGVALLRLLLETMSDSETEENEKLNSTEIPTVKENFAIKIAREIKVKFNSIFNIHLWIMMNHLIMMPSVLYKMNARAIDVNQIHPTSLCGKKVRNLKIRYANQFF